VLINSEEQKPISLVLSGGGIRAMVFHLGVLKFLAERGMLECVQKISTVSGGSLIIGLILQECSLQWPSSSEFVEKVYPQLRERLCARSLMWGAFRQLKNCSNWKFILSRANLLALALQNEWGLKDKLKDLPILPEWSINGTTAENGKRFRFKRESIGDYMIGYALPGDFPLANAIAVSAAFPVGFGPLILKTNKFVWKKRNWNDALDSEKVITIPHKNLHLYDGGIYDNLGLEPFFDAGRLKAKPPVMPIILSDAGAPLAEGFFHGSFSLHRLKRVLDIISEQARSLRVRTFASYLQAAPARGAYIQINAKIDGISCKYGDFAASFPTSLRRLNMVEFDKLATHGYSVATQVERHFGLVSYDIPAGILG
jgi:NTE family protein